MTAINTTSLWRQQDFIAKNLTMEHTKAIGKNFTNQTYKITPYYLKLTEQYPILRKIVIPSEEEFLVRDEELADPIGDKKDEVVPYLIHKYPTKCLLYVSNSCASYCRYCVRKESVHTQSAKIGDVSSAWIKYIEEHKEIVEVILSGGDPLSLSTLKLSKLLYSINNIEHVKLIRIHTRYPIYNPYRLDGNLQMLLNSYNLHLVLHIVHPKEITKELTSRLEPLRCNIYNQAVILKNVNDNVETIKELCLKCGENNIVPYYMYYPDLNKGNSHFRPIIEKVIDISQRLEGKLPGYLMPKFIIDIPGGHGKIPLDSSFVKKNKGPNCFNFPYLFKSPLTGEFYEYKEVI